MEHLAREFEVDVPETLEELDLPLLLRIHKRPLTLWVGIQARSLERTQRWVERLLKDPDFLADLLTQLEERPYVLHHRDVDSALPYPAGEEDYGKTHVTISCKTIEELLFEGHI